MIAALAASLAACGTIGCSVAAEEPVLAQFFSASRLRDNTALARLSTVRFEPHLDGIVTTFSITGVTPEQRTPLVSDLVELSVDDALSKGDIAKADGEMVSKDVTLDAQVRRLDGQIVRETLVITMQRAVLKGDPAIVGRWIVTGIAESGT